MFFPYATTKSLISLVSYLYELAISVIEGVLG